MYPPKDKSPADAPRAEAAEWFVTLQATDVSRAEQEAFADWLRRSPVNVEEFLQLTTLYGELSHLPALCGTDVTALQSAALKGRENIIDGVFAFPSRTASSSSQEARQSWRLRFVSIAAAAALIGIGLFSIHPIRSFIGAEHYTAFGEQRSLTLADGSRVQLNVQSSLTANVNDAIRDVSLSDGEALFHVAKDPSRPFRVHTPQATIEAKGTEFNVNVIDGETIVALLEGRVEVRTSQDTPPVLLEPGQQLTIATRALERPTPRKADLKAVTAWTEQRLVFEDAPLSEVIAEFNRYSRQTLVIRDPALRDTRITASFESGSAQTFGASLAAASGLRVVQQPDNTWLIER